MSLLPKKCLMVFYFNFILSSNMHSLTYYILKDINLIAFKSIRENIRFNVLNKYDGKINQTMEV